MKFMMTNRNKDDIDSWANMEIGFLTETERDFIVNVLKRDEKLKLLEQKRIINLKCELRDVRRRGAKRADLTYSSHVCERCNASTKHLKNKSVRCQVCRHKICDNCQRSSFEGISICIVCYKESSIKTKTGEWFYDAMRAELKPMADGCTLLKQAVIRTSKPNSPTPKFHTPEILCTQASSSSHSSQRQELISCGSMESLSSSLETPSPQKVGNLFPETGSIESLRSLRYMSNRESYFSDSDHSVTSLPITKGHRARTSLSHSPQSSPSLFDTSLSKPEASSLAHQSIPSDDFSRASAYFPDHSTTHDNESLGSRHKGQSTVKKKFLAASGKLQAHRILSRSVPSLVNFNESESSDKSTPGSAKTKFAKKHKNSLSVSSMEMFGKIIPEEVARSTGEIKFSLDFEYKTNTLVIFIAGCRNLIYVGKHCEPYVKCYLLPDRTTKKKTSARKNTTFPIFDQEIKYSVTMDELCNRVLEMSVWNAATFSRNSFLGHLQIPFNTWKWTPQSVAHWYPLKALSSVNSLHTSSTYKGDILIAVCYEAPKTQGFGDVHVMVKHAKNLIPVLPNGTVNAYVKVSLLPGKESRKKTVVVEGGNDPVWNVTFRLPLNRKVEQSGVQVTVWHKSSGTKPPELLGGIRLVSKLVAYMTSPTAEEELFWNQVCDSPGLWIDKSVGLRALL
ncbi:synaptotagmin-like protein 4 isoform X2 [Clavelina lepadiformis]|uniref:synaptotagmin-like protein 4 isoform X2 n=1 Tax=Clavelina lepadiformis TaxID=159417 RepID=UPI004041A615